MSIILASKSPRRRYLLDKLGVEFKVVPSNIVENIHDHVEPEINVMSVAFEKAIDVANNHPEDVVIAADTIVVFNDEILEKPENEDDALRMLKKMNNDSHYVYTGFAIVNLEKHIKIVDYEKTEIKFRNNSNDKLIRYCKTGEPLDKAGAYGIQKKGALLVEKVNGDYFNVVGLPISKISELLEENYNIKLL